jgi:Fur family peroxide stress response transcriptional regulator
MKPKRKHSAKRDAILALLKRTKTHPSAQWVYNHLRPQIPGLSLGTVYRNLSLFREEGIAASVGVINGEERFDGTVESHPHLVCSRCGKVMDLPVEKGTELAKNFSFASGAVSSPGSVPEVEDDFTIDFKKTVFYGLCKDCKTAF